MRRIIPFMLISLALAASPASAQVTLQGSLGASGNAAFPERVQGSDGNSYICRADTKVSNGKRVRECVRDEDDSGTVFGQGTGLSPAVGAGAIVALLVVAAAGGGGGSSTTTTTPGG